MNVHLGPGDYFGKTVRSTAMPLFCLSENVYDHSSVLPQHSHERPYFCLLVDGAFEETYRRESRQHAKNEVVFQPAGHVHADRFGPQGGRCFSIEVDPCWLESACEADAQQLQSIITSKGEMSWLAQRLYREFCKPDNWSQLAAEGLVSLLLAELLREKQREEGPVAPKWLSSVRDRLSEQPDASLTLAELAKIANVHPVHLAREFRRYYHCSVGEYVRRTRIERACVALSSSDVALGEIALAAGFSDQAHFTRTFKALTGMTPSAYRDGRR
ncbi:MAG: helix-turn-helix transcriptional regulator [Armatimonadetes bacterium]|nr:helix-turn-helix transcriptional regulator [Armatimonadota bacterium]